MKKVGTATIVWCVVVVAAPYFSLDYNGSAGASDEPREVSTELSSATDSPTALVPENNGEISNFLFLGDECPVPLDETVWTDKKCLAAINKYFIDEPAYVIEFPGMVSRGGWFTYRTMFEQHGNDKKLVAAAFSNPDCLLLEGPMRLDLRGTCNADAVSRYTQFASLCYYASYFNWFEPDDFFGGKSKYEKELNGMEDFESYRERRHDDLEKYLSWRNWVRKSALHDTWLESSNKCPIEFLSPRESHSQRPPHYDLEEIAARLGDERMLFASQGCTGWYGDKHYQRTKHKAYPWQSQIHTAIGGIGTLFTNAKRTQAIASAARGIVGMRKAGYEADLERIVTSLCESSLLQDSGNVKDCASAYESAQVLVDPIETKVIQALDEIKDTAVMLDLFESL